MRSNSDRASEPTNREAILSAFGSAMVRFALLFSTAGVALALFLAPMMERSERPIMARNDLDRMSTGSIDQSYVGTYTVRRSVLSDDPRAVCVIRDNGRRIGDC